MVKKSLNWYDEQTRENDVYGTAKQKEKATLKILMKDRVVLH